MIRFYNVYKHKNILKSCRKTNVSDRSKPLNELCKQVNYSIADKDPKDICQYSPWNNMTRISLVKMLLNLTYINTNG